jgi:glycosyltransferase involved in cell wall biosynthesis
VTVGDGRVRILLVTGPSTGGSARVRALQLVPHLASAGHDVQTLAWEVRGRLALLRRGIGLLRAARHAEVVVVQKPTQHPLLLRAIGRRVPLVIDIDDAVWVGSGGTPTEGSRRIERRLRRSAPHIALVVAGSAWLADALTARLPGVRIEVLGSAVDLAAWDEARRAAVRARPPHIVWIGSSGNLRDLHQDFLEGLAPVVAEGLARFEVVCDEAPDLPGLEVVHTPWTLEGEMLPLVRATIGVMPLLDDERAQGRCSFKAVQYLAAGIVPVASPIGGATEVVRDGETGCAATSATEWEAALRMLLTDPARRTRLVTEGRALVAQRHEVRAQATRWSELLGELVA